MRRGNKMARERMTILYDHSARWQALVLGTSNKTELLLRIRSLLKSRQNQNNLDRALAYIEAVERGEK